MPYNQFCRYCHREIALNSVYCNWCGGKQIKLPDVVDVPKPKKIKSGYTAQIMVKGTRVRVTEATEEDYYRVATEYKTGKRTTEQNITLAEAIDRYKEEKKNRLSVRSLEQYEYIKLHRFQSLMPMKICDITNRDIDRAIEAELCKKSRKGGTISNKTVRDAAGLVLAVLKRYTDNTYRIDLPEKQKTFYDYPSAEEVIKAVKGTDIELPALLALWLGMSAEEIRGLTKSKSMINGKLYIVETVVDTKDGALRKPGAKAKDRPRAYNIPPYIQGLIDAVPGDIIEPRTSHALYMRLQKVLEKAGVKKIRFHDLRHLNAATQTSLAIPEKVIQERNGWSSNKMLHTVYDYVFTADREKADNVIDGYFTGLLE